MKMYTTTDGEIDVILDYGLDLKQLLKECGTGFRSLSLHSDGRWIAKSGHNALPTKRLFVGKTAEEALCKLLQALKNEEIPNNLR